MNRYLISFFAFVIGATSLCAQENQDTIALKEVKVKGKRKRTKSRIELN